jgi:hypothetical protein
VLGKILEPMGANNRRLEKLDMTCTPYKILIWGRMVAQLVEALRHKPEGRGMFHWLIPLDRTMALGSTQPLTEMSTSVISWGAGGGGG